MCKFDPGGVPLSHVVFELVAYALAGVLFWHARHRERGLRWASTLFWGMAYGLVVELLLVNSTGSQYSYGPFLVMIPPCGSGAYQVPLCVGVGWGEMLYVSTWTAQRLALPWQLRPLAAAVLAVNIDLSLDPVAQQQGFWHWSGGQFFGVPFDNFLGWFVIIALYAGAVRGGFRLAGRRFERPHENVWFALLLPFFAALAALTGLWLVEVLATAVRGSRGPGNETFLFIAVFSIACTIAWVYALRSRRDHIPSWQVLAVPLTFHALSLATFVVSWARDESPELTPLIVLIPLNLFVGAFAYAWISLDALFPESSRARAARSRSSREPAAEKVEGSGDAPLET